MGQISGDFLWNIKEHPKQVFLDAQEHQGQVPLVPPDLDGPLEEFLGLRQLVQILEDVGQVVHSLVIVRVQAQGLPIALNGSVPLTAVAGVLCNVVVHLHKEWLL